MVQYSIERIAFYTDNIPKAFRHELFLVLPDFYFITHIVLVFRNIWLMSHSWLFARDHMAFNKCFSGRAEIKIAKFKMTPITGLSLGHTSRAA